MSSGNDVTEPYRRAVSRWLLLCIALVMLMVAVGGYTRLSGSGLSITEWKPIHGTIPPIGDAEWEEEFTAYKASPQFEKVNSGMTPEEFKGIYWPEYFHRLLGRSIGLVLLLPLIWFMHRKVLSRRFAQRMLAIFALGAVQGGMGWYMVKSGLAHDPHVSHYRLAAHLALALVIIGFLIWQWLALVAPWREGRVMTFGRLICPSCTSRLLMAAVFVQIVYGALVAGLHAGLLYNTFPTMDGLWLPPDLWPENMSLFDILTANPPTVQFIHRWLAVAIGLAVILWWFAIRPHAIHAALKRALDALLAVCLLQIVLGILTLVHAVPLTLALMHQMNGLLLFALTVVAVHAMHRSHGRTETECPGCP